MTDSTDNTQPLVIADLPARKRATNPELSCIVQAPAGSGKTTLLAERFVALLAGVSQPEQILAITFTKKAAAEMRHRVREELANPDSELGNAAMARSQELNWGLEHYPSRLRIQTIDAFAMSLVKQLPITSKLQQRDVCAHPDEYYQRAVARVVQRIAEPNPSPDNNDTTATLLRDFDSNTTQVQNLLVTMLRRREQWLFSLADQLTDFNTEQLVSAISDGITALQQEALNGLLDTMLLPVRHRLLEFAGYASDCLGTKVAFADLAEFEQWRFITQNLVLTASGTLDKPQIRRALNKNNGFPPTKENTHKQDLLELLKEFAGDPSYADMLQSFTAIRDIPQLDAATLDRDRLSVIGTMLYNCVFELNNLFDERGEVDYNQITIAAITALGTDDAPSELALSLDYRISHLLIDEFQDTSRSQHMLFSRLIKEWTPEDNNTFFAVGDPMQSIYRFRNAEVSLFLEVCSNGMANLNLEHLTLTTNFRSTDTMIGWFNQVFGPVLGTRDDTNLGRIRYATATSPRGELATLAKTELFAPMQLSESVEEQHEQLIAHIHQLLKQQDVQLTDIAILVRNRTPVGPLVRSLESAGIAWQGTDLHALAATAIVSDLVALANTLFDPADRNSAMALLRSPLVGLTLNDLYTVAQFLKNDGAAEPLSLVSLMRLDSDGTQTSPLPGMSDEGHARLTRLISAATDSVKTRLQLAPRELIESIWLQLGGPAAYPATQLKHAERLLDTIELNHPTHFSPQQLQQDIKKLYAEDDGTGVQILTVHKSKGLQYKHVLLPHLEAGTRADESALMLQRASSVGTLLACKAPGRDPKFDEKNKTVYHWLKLEDKQRALNETRRVLYVAATRAEQTLKMFATLPPEKTSVTAGSLLSCLANVYGELWEGREKPEPELATDVDAQDADNTEDNIVIINALPASLPLPSLPAPDVSLPERSRNITGRDAPDEPDLLFALERRAAILRGNLTHEALCSLTQTLAETGTTGAVDQLTCEQAVNTLIANERHLWEQQAQQLGLDIEQSSDLANIVAQQLLQTAGSPLGRWCALSPQTDSQAEIGLTLWENAGPLALIVDRMFVHERANKQNERWIIDYKTATPDTAPGSQTDTNIGSSDWLKDELIRYTSQLSRYARAVHAMQPDTKIRTALYFTASDQLWETGLPTPGPDGSIELKNETSAQNISYDDLTA